MTTSFKADEYQKRFRGNEWRALVFRDLILDDAKALRKERENLVLLDIGCGCGFDGSLKLQNDFVKVAGQFFGIEPDQDTKISGPFTSTYSCLFEDTDIPPSSVDIAFAVMVLEHLASPQSFIDKLFACLRPGGVFWGFTVDVRHPFVVASRLSERVHLKDRYLTWLHGSRGQDRYRNHPTYYRCNTPHQIESLTKSFSKCAVVNFKASNQLDYYFPAALRWLGTGYCRLAMTMGWPGSILAVRLEK